jgi:hypothetical protein
MNALKSLLILACLVGSTSAFAANVGMVPVVRAPVGATVLLDTHRNKFAALNSCGGTVELKMVAGQADLIFRGVRNCSEFDILESNGRATRFPHAKLQGVQGDRSGSFTLPRYVLDFGYNGVLVNMKSQSGKHDDVIFVQFFDL